MITSNLVINAEKPYQADASSLLPRKIRKPSIKHTANKALSGFTTGELLSSIQPNPSRTVLLGRCSDGLPFLMTLSDLETGTILIGGDAGCGKTHHLQVMVDSLIRTSAPRDLQILILSHHPEEWQGWRELPEKGKYFQGVHAWYDPAAEGAIQLLMGAAETRRKSGDADPHVLIILDDLNFIEELSFEAQVSLRWLLAYGAQSNVWMIGTINSGMAAAYRYWLESFGTRIIGQVRSKARMADLTLVNGMQMKTLAPGEFRVWTGEDWLTYQIPLLGG